MAKDSPFEIAMERIRYYMRSPGETFTLDQLRKEIVEAGGVMIVAPGISVKDHIDRLEWKGYFRWDHATKRYIVI